MSGHRSLRTRLVAGLTAAALPCLVLGLEQPAGAVAASCSGVPQDINGDSFADIAVGEPNGGPDRAGRVHVFYGTASGPATAATGDAPDDQVLGQGVGGLPGSPVAGDGFGATVLVEDFDGDGCADVAVAAPGDRQGAGRVWVLYGSTTGVRTAGASVHDERVFGGTIDRTGEQFGAALAAGDYDDDGITDLAVGAPFERVFDDEETRQGRVFVLYGTPSGLADVDVRPELFDQSSIGVPNDPEAGDGFGLALAAGDVTGDGIDDVAVGVPGENRAAGIVQVIPGTSAGLQGTGTTTWSQDTAGVPGAQEVEDNFGFAVAVGDVDGDGGGDLVVGVPGENRGAGSVVTLFSGTTGRIEGAGAQVRSADSTGIDGTADAADYFGWVVAAGRLDGDRFADVAVGTPRDTVAGVQDAGSVTLLRGSSGGLSVAGYGGTRLTQASTNVPGAPEASDLFGFMVAISPVQGLSVANLVVGVPGESVGTVAGAGEVVVLRAARTGPVTKGARTLNANTPGVAGVSRRDSFWGLSVD